MAAQAAVLSATSSTDVNLVKRTPNGDDETEQNDMTGQSSSGSTSQDSTDDQSSSAPTPQDSIAGQSSSAPTPQGPLTDKEEEEMQKSLDILRGKTDILRELIQSQRGEISELKALVKQLKRTCEGEASSGCSNINAEIAEFKEKIAELKNQLEETTEEYRTGLDGYYRVVMATRSKNYAFLRQYIQDHQY
ncbi:hypothetical protein BASA82_001251 [Batrachochytrium salamandrivorans]|nr:hypothetical protein BASA82_001251 [Batrachochytrium salamandrivorans]